MSTRTITNSRLVDGAKIDNLPNDTNAALSSKIGEAPIDGNYYARKDASWSTIQGSAGATGPT